MTTEYWLALSILFSLALAGIGWVVQFRLTRDGRRYSSQIQEFEDTLQANARELKSLRDELRASELMSMLFALAWPGDRTEAEIDAIAHRAKARIGSISSRMVFHERIENAERALDAMERRFEQLPRSAQALNPLSGFED